MEYMNAVGSRGISVDKYFDIKGPTSYLGLMMPGFPNLFRLYGLWILREMGMIGVDPYLRDVF